MKTVCANACYIESNHNVFQLFVVIERFFIDCSYFKDALAFRDCSRNGDFALLTAGSCQTDYRYRTVCSVRFCHFIPDICIFKLRYHFRNWILPFGRQGNKFLLSRFQSSQSFLNHLIRYIRLRQQLGQVFQSLFKDVSRLFCICIQVFTFCFFNLRFKRLKLFRLRLLHQPGRCVV